MLKKLAVTGIVGFAAAGIMLAGGPAGADVDDISNHGSGILSGNQVIVPVSVAANVCGNNIPVVNILSKSEANSGKCEATSKFSETNKIEKKHKKYKKHGY